MSTHRGGSVRSLSEEQSGVVHRRQLYELGWTRWQVDAQLDGGRWAQVAGGVIITHRGPLPDRARWWAAVLQVGPRAVLAGSTALQAAGLTGVSDDVIHVAAPKSSRPRRPPGVRVHETRLLSHDDVLRAGLPRVRPVAAAVQAALWARSDRQACLYLVSTVQQRLVTAVDLADRLARVTRHRRLPLLRSVVGDVVDGAQALSELDFAALCRRRGLPQPTRQSVVTTALGRCSSTSTGRTGAWRPRSTAATTCGSAPGWTTPGGRTRSSSMDDGCCGSRCWRFASTPNARWTRRRRRCGVLAGAQRRVGGLPADGDSGARCSTQTRRTPRDALAGPRRPHRPTIRGA